MGSNWDKYDLAYVSKDEDYYNGNIFDTYCCASSDISSDWTTTATKADSIIGYGTPCIEIAGGNVIKTVDGGPIEITAPALTIDGQIVATKEDVDCNIDELKRLVEDKSSFFEAQDDYILNEIEKLKIGLADLREELKAQQSYGIIHGLKRLF